MTKLEILDLAVNEIEEIEGLDGASESLEELWINNNKIADWKNFEYMGATLKKIDNLYIAGNPVYARGEEFKKKLKETVPTLTQVEGTPFDRPIYFFK